MELLTPDQAAGLLKVHVETLRLWRRQCDKGHQIGPPWTFVGKKPRYRADLLKATSTLKGYVEAFPPEPPKQTFDGQSGWIEIEEPPEFEGSADPADLKALIDRIIAED
jgi:hypothetical protein